MRTADGIHIGLVLALLAGCGGDPESPPPDGGSPPDGSDASEPDMPTADGSTLSVCGDGLVQGDEVCDWGVNWAAPTDPNSCPDGWGACTTCAWDCQGMLFPLGLPCVTANEQREYDERARLVRVQEFDEDGLVLGEVRYEYDPAGNQTRRREFLGPERVLASETRATFDAQRRPLSGWEDANGDGRAERSHTTDYEGQDSTTRHDFDGDGEIDQVVDLRLDDERRFVEAVYREGVEFDVVRRSVWTYDEPEGAYQRFTSYDGEGNVSSRSESFFDPETRRSVTHSDLDGDGEFDVITRYAYDELNRELAYVFESPVGEVARSRTTTYEDETRSTEIERFSGEGARGNGITIQRRNSQGALVFEREPDGTELTLDYDERGNQVGLRRVSGSRDRRVTRAFDPTTGYPVSETRTVDGVTTDVSYDCNESAFAEMPLRTTAPPDPGPPYYIP